MARGKRNGGSQAQDRWRIRYVDAEGVTTERVIKVIALVPETGHIDAWCELRGDTRTFVASRVQEAVDVETGEIVDLQRRFAAAGSGSQPQPQPQPQHVRPAAVEASAPAAPPQRPGFSAIFLLGIAALAFGLGFVIRGSGQAEEEGPVPAAPARYVPPRELLDAFLLVEREATDPAQVALVNCMAGRSVLSLSGKPSPMPTRKECQQIAKRAKLPPSAIAKRAS